jgi:hypothetical protein
MIHTKIDQNYFLIAQPIGKKQEAIVVTKPTNHVFVVDVSGSMSYELRNIRTQLKNKLSTTMKDGDTISIVWFSGRSDAGILKEEVEVKSLKTLSDLNDAIDRWLKPVGMTAFLKPLHLVKEIVARIKVNRPNSVFSLIFLTDGYNNDCPWPEVLKALTEIQNDFASSAFVEYGYYADSKKLTEMAAVMGGEKISCSGFDDFEPMFDKKISTGQTGGKKILVDVPADLYDFAYSISPAGGVILYNIDNGKILVSEDVKEVYFFSTKPQGAESLLDATALYAAAYVLSDKLLNDDAEKLFYALGDPFYYKMLANAFGKQKLNAFKTAMNECVTDISKRFPEGHATITPVDDNAYCLMDLINDLGSMDNKFYPNHEEFNYNRIGRKRVATVNEGCEEEEVVDATFVDDDVTPGYGLNNLVWNENRANLSVLCRITGNVTLSDNKYGIKEVPSFKFRAYTLIKDGILNITKLPVNYSQELYDLLLSKGINAEIQENYIILDLGSLPIVNKGMIKALSAVALAEQEWELLKLQGQKKVYDYFRKALFPKESKSYSDTYGIEASAWLKDLGVTDYNGFSPKTTAVPSTDFYMSVNLFTKVKGLSSLPKVEDVIAKLEKGAELKTSDWLLSGTILEYNAQINSPMYQTLKADEQTKILQNYIISKSDDLNKARRQALCEIAKIKFSLILSKKWFTEFKSFDENTLNVILDGQNLGFTFELTEKEEKI